MTFTNDLADQLPDVVGHKLAGRVTYYPWLRR
jgi:hypothetical protein